MKILLKKMKFGIFPNGYGWLAVDDYNRTGTGKTQAEALGDLILGYSPLENNEDGTSTLIVDVELRIK